MNENLFSVKTAIAAFFTALGAFLGWKGIMLMTWVVVMFLDYISGTMAACKKGDWSSAIAREGLWHKGAMILVVAVSAIADVIMVIIAEYVPIGIQWPGILMPMVLAWYIITELGSILENAVKMGANVPGWLVNLLKASVKVMEEVGDQKIHGGISEYDMDDRTDSGLLTEE